jgi:SsrA-binding protein
MAADKSKEGKKSESPVIATNKRARRDYHLEERFEAGLQLQGSEVKSIRDRKASLDQSFGRIIKGELYLTGMHIAEYAQAGPFTHNPLRPRKLLLHKREIERIVSRISQKGYTLVPTRLYFKRGLVKVEVAIATGKREFDKREDIKKRDAEREMKRAIRAARR